MLRILRTPRARSSTPRGRRPQLEQLEARVVPVNPSVLDPNLAVRTVVSGLDQPTSMAFLGENDFLILEKATGKVKHVVNGAVVGTALDLAVNNNSERGLLGIALDPTFATNHAVYLYWIDLKEIEARQTGQLPEVIWPKRGDPHPAVAESELQRLVDAPDLGPAAELNASSLGLAGGRSVTGDEVATR